MKALLLNSNSVTAKALSEALGAAVAMEENKPLSGKPVEPKKPAPTQEESIKIPAPVSK